MDNDLLAFQVAAGILLAGICILLVRTGIAIFRVNSGIRGFFGFVLFMGGMALSWATMIAGTPP